MIMCAEHHCNIDLCGCDADAQYRAAQSKAKPPHTMSEKTEDRRDEVFCDDGGLWVRDTQGNCRPFDIHDYESLADERSEALQAIRELTADLEGANANTAVAWTHRDYWKARALTAEAEVLSLRGALEKVARLPAAMTGGAPGSYQRGHDNGYNSGLEVAKAFARSALLDGVEPQ